MIGALVFGALGQYVAAGIRVPVPVSFVLLVRALVGDAGRFFHHDDDHVDEDIG